MNIPVPQGRACYPERRVLPVAGQHPSPQATFMDSGCRIRGHKHA
jgi:hypothetical protein